MKHMQPTTPGFVLTSMSFKQTDIQKTNKNAWQQTNNQPHSSIAKFDYCLPPEELVNEEASKQSNAA